MTILANKQSRDLIGVNTFERAIIYSGCLLLSAVSTKGYNRDFAIIADKSVKTIYIYFELPIDMPLFWASMGDPDDSLKSITDDEIIYQGEYLPTYTTLENEPPSINILEKYFVWACKNLAKFYSNNLTELNDNITIVTNLKKGTLTVDVKLEYDPAIYESTDSLLAAVISKSNASDSTTLVGSDLFGNAFLVGN